MTADNRHSVKLTDSVIVDDDVDDPTYFCESRYGWRIPPDLWIRYATARSVLEHVAAEIRTHERVPYPIPPAGTLARRFYDAYRDDLQRSVEAMERIHQWGIPRSPRGLDHLRVSASASDSMDDGSIDRLRRALEVSDG